MFAFDYEGDKSMKNKTIVLAVIILILSIFNINSVWAYTYFIDIFGHWAQNEILWSSNEMELFLGYEDGTFKPDNNITRAEFAAILYRAVNEKSIFMDNNINISNDKSLDSQDYSDIDETFWAYKNIKTLQKYIDIQNKDINFKDIFPGDRFYPNKFITREEAVLLSSFFTMPPLKKEAIEFKDLNYNYMYYDQIKDMAKNKIILGYSNGNFMPKEKVTRAEAATIMRRIVYEMDFLKDGFLNKIHLNTSIYDSKFMFFGDYFETYTERKDLLYKRAISTLEYESMVKVIPYEERHLYDEEPISTLKSLKEQDYWNIAGLNYYLLQYGGFDEKQNLKLAKEMIDDFIARDDLNANESKLILQLAIKHLDNKELIIKGLDKWYNLVKDMEEKLDVVFLKSKIYMENKKYQEALKDYIDIESQGDILSELDTDVISNFYLNKGFIYYKQKKYKECENILRNGLERLKGEYNLNEKINSYFSNVNNGSLKFNANMYSFGTLINILYEEGFLPREELDTYKQFIGGIKKAMDSYKD